MPYFLPATITNPPPGGDTTGITLQRTVHYYFLPVQASNCPDPISGQLWPRGNPEPVEVP